VGVVVDVARMSRKRVYALWRNPGRLTERHDSRISARFAGVIRATSLSLQGAGHDYLPAGADHCRSLSSIAFDLGESSSGGACAPRR
jgi:hypothetical protein